MKILLTTFALTASLYGREIEDPRIGEGSYNARIEFLDDGLYFIFYQGHVYATDKLYHLDNCRCYDD